MSDKPAAPDEDAQATHQGAPELEVTPGAEGAMPRDELPYRLKQQALLGAFGRFAMQSRDLSAILQYAAELCAKGLEAPYSKVLEYLPESNQLEVRAGVGWQAGTIDEVALGADLASPAGYAYHTGQSVISNHLHDDARFRTPKLLADHGVKRAINVLIERGNEIAQPYGVLEVDSPDPGQFDLNDADFLAGFAGLLGIAIERQQADAKLAEAMEYQGLLTREMSHRVKNSLMSVVSLLRVQSRSAQSEDVVSALDDASARVETIAQVHDHLWRGDAISFIELSDFVSELCKKMNETTPAHTISCTADAFVLTADHAVPLGLLINELVTNASKYAYPDGAGDIHVFARKRGGNLEIEVSDHGIGLPEDFILDQPRKSLGFRLITGFVRQLGGRLLVEKNEPTGARFTVEMPILDEPGLDPAAS